jgi:hypothetical protein
MKKIYLSLFFVFWAQFSFATSIECDGQFSHIVPGVVPLEDAFRSTVKTTGTLNERMSGLQTRWPSNVKFVKNVKMKVNLGTGDNLRSQDFFVISLDGLDEAKQAELLNDYLDSIAHNSVSFPLGSEAGHLFTRVGTKTYDNLWGLHVNEYRTPNSDRLETVLSLSDHEMENLRWYTHHAEKNHANVVGDFFYEGTKTSEGKLDKNLATCPTSNGHNCTSWMGLAPIGENGEPLKELIGAHAWDIARNPGWMTAYIHARTPQARTPFNVFISTSDFSFLDDMIATDKVLEWRYDLH